MGMSNKMGMSNLPRNVPTGTEAYRYAELMICVLPQWKVDQESFKDMKYDSPIYLLKSPARFPFEYNSWPKFGYSIPNGDPSEPYHDRLYRRRFAIADRCGAIV
mgnify:CR=1 FL=1